MKTSKVSRPAVERPGSVLVYYTWQTKHGQREPGLNDSEFREGSFSQSRKHEREKARKEGSQLTHRDSMAGNPANSHSTSYFVFSYFRAFVVKTQLPEL